MKQITTEIKSKTKIENLAIAIHEWKTYQQWNKIHKKYCQLCKKELKAQKVVNK